MNSSEPHDSESPPTYDTLVHKLARAGWLQRVIRMLLYAPVVVGVFYTITGARPGEEVNISVPIGVAHFVLLPVALGLFAGMCGGPGLTANVRALNAVRKSRSGRQNPQQRSTEMAEKVLNVGYTLVAIPMYLGMSLGDIVGSEVVRWVSTCIGWAVFGAIALFIRHVMNLAARQRATIAQSPRSTKVETIPAPDLTSTATTRPRETPQSSPRATPTDE